MPPAAASLERARAFLRSPRFPIFMIVFVDVLGVGITLPVLPLYAEKIFGATALQVTLLASVYFTAQFLASPRLGRLSDRVGRRPVLVLSQAGTFLALLISGLAPALPLLYVARTIDGLTGGNISVAQAYLSDITSDRDRARGIGLVNAAFSAGFVFGPAFGGLVAGWFGPRVPFFIAAAISLFTVSLSYFLLPESLSPERRQAAAARAPQARGAARSAVLRAPGVLAIMLAGFFGQFAFFNFQSIYVLWAARMVFPGRDSQYVQQAVGALLTFVGLVGIATQLWLVGPLVRRFGEKRMVSGGLALRGVGWLVMLLLPFVVPVALAVPLVSVGGGVAVPALLALLTYAVPSDQRGYAIGLLESIQGVGRILGPITAGLLFEHMHPSAPMAAAVLLSGVAALASLQIRRWPAAPGPGRAAPPD